MIGFEIEGDFRKERENLERGASWIVQSLQIVRQMDILFLYFRDHDTTT
jgi:hypothetical protein